MQIITQLNQSSCDKFAIGPEEIRIRIIKISWSNKIEARTYKKIKKIAKILPRTPFSRLISLCKEIISD